MIVDQLRADSAFRLLNDGGNGEDEVTAVYCCDLLSCVMGSAPACCVWVTIMNNINALAVASLTDCAAIVLAAGIRADAAMIAKAMQQGITLYECDDPIFETALRVHAMMA